MTPEQRKEHGRKAHAARFKSKQQMTQDPVKNDENHTHGTKHGYDSNTQTDTSRMTHDAVRATSEPSTPSGACINEA